MVSSAALMHTARDWSFVSLDDSLQTTGDIQNFECGETEWAGEVLEFLRSDAWQHQRQGLSHTTLIFHNKLLAGFFSLLASNIRAEEGSRLQGLDLPSEGVRVWPCVSIGQFAVSQDFQRQKVGSLVLLPWIRGLARDTRIGVRFLTLYVRAANETGREFWRSNGFKEAPGVDGTDYVFMLYDLFQSRP